MRTAVPKWDDGIMLDRPELSGRPGLTWNNGTVNVCCDGNSLTEGLRSTVPATKSYPAVMASSLFPVAGNVVTNVGISGQQWTSMTSTITDVNAAWNAGKTNVLVCFEDTNEIYNGSTRAQVTTNMLAYFAAVLAVHAWKIVLCSCIPRYGVIGSVGSYSQPDVDDYNARINAVNAYNRANWRSYGISHFIDVAADPLFALSSYTAADFDAVGGITPVYYQEPDRGSIGRVHLTDYGYSRLAAIIAGGLRRVPK